MNIEDVLVGAILVAVGMALSSIRALFQGYGTKKGENIATREDVDRVSRKVEALQAEFSAAVRKAAAAHSQRFALEVSIYRDLWQDVLDLQGAADEIWQDGLAKRAPSQTYQAFRIKLEELQAGIRKASPFFPLEMQGHLLQAQLPVRRVAVELTHIDFDSPEAVKAYLDFNLPEVWDALRALEEAIRTRLWADDSDLQRLTGARTQRTGHIFAEQEVK